MNFHVLKSDMEQSVRNETDSKKNLKIFPKNQVQNSPFKIKSTETAIFWGFRIFELKRI